MKALDRKLLRDLALLRGQVLTVALVIAVGIASYVTLQSNLYSLSYAKDAYYESTRFADVFASLEHAPAAVARKVAELPGVLVAEPRISELVSLPMPGRAEPAVGRLIGLPETRDPALNALVLRSGRLPERGRADEALVLASFATAHALELGGAIPVVMNGVLHRVRVVGTAISPEYVFSVGAGQMTQDDAAFAVLWMGEGAVAATFQMEGAFNDVAVRLQPGAREAEVLGRIDGLLRPYGGMGAAPRAHQASNFIIENELSQLRSQASLSFLFLAVGAFLLNVVLSRLVQLQRGQIAVLKALGYGNAAVGLHVLWFAGVIVALGSALGIGAGALLGRGMIGLYARFFRFPSLSLHLDATLVGQALGVSVVAGVLGALASVVRVARLQPAEAMRPEAPTTYRPTLLERLGAGRLVDPAGRMVLRELLRRPLRTALNVAGVACAIGVAFTGRISYDMIAMLEQVQFQTAQHEDLAVSFRHVVPDRAAAELAHVPGVLAVEPMRALPARVRSGHRARDIVVTAYPEGATLREIVAWPLSTVSVPAEGLLVTDVLAQALGVGVGDRVSIEVREGSRPVRTALVTGLVRDLFGLNAYMSLASLHRLLGEVEGLSTVLLTTDPSQETAVEARLQAMPSVARIERRRTALERFHAQTSETMWISAGVLTLFGVVVALGVVYNAARVALSMRGRDLATLRVLGFTQAEVAGVLIGELAAYVVLAIVPGFAFGDWFIRTAIGSGADEMFRMPVEASGATYAFALGATLVAAAISAVLVRRRLSQLDLVHVLKAPE